MKLVARDPESLTFELDRRERELLVYLLRRYPVLEPAYHQIAGPNDRAALAAEQQLLTESLTADQTENRRRVEAFVQSRLTPAPADSAKSSPSRRPFRITLAEADWLLRIINDVRVGCWVRLGCPEESSMHSPQLTARNVTDYTAMELGGLVLSVLLAALEAEAG